jgi:hypothetical protein
VSNMDNAVQWCSDLHSRDPTACRKDSLSQNFLKRYNPECLICESIRRSRTTSVTNSECAASHSGLLVSSPHRLTVSSLRGTAFVS